MFCLLSTLALRLSDLSPTFFSEAGFLRSLFHIILLLDVYLSLFTLGYLGISLPFLYLYTQGIGIYRYLFTYNASSFPMCLYQLSCIIHPLLRSLSILRLGFASSHIPLWFTFHILLPLFHLRASNGSPRRHHSISPSPSLSQQSPALSYIENPIFLYSLFLIPRSAFVTLLDFHLFSPYSIPSAFCRALANCSTNTTNSHVIRFMLNWGWPREILRLCKNMDGRFSRCFFQHLKCWQTDVRYVPFTCPFTQFTVCVRERVCVRVFPELIPSQPRPRPHEVRGKTHHRESSGALWTAYEMIICLGDQWRSCFHAWREVHRLITVVAGVGGGGQMYSKTVL